MFQDHAAGTASLHINNDLNIFNHFNNQCNDDLHILDHDTSDDDLNNIVDQDPGEC